MFALYLGTALEMELEKSHIENRLDLADLDDRSPNISYLLQTSLPVSEPYTPMNVSLQFLYDMFKALFLSGCLPPTKCQLSNPQQFH